MADRTVTVRLRLDASQWAAGQRAATTSTTQLSTAARAAATQAERDAQRTATAIQGTFRGMAAAGTAALGTLDAAAARSSQAVARSSSAAAASTRQVGAAASEIPATFRAAEAAGTTALGRIDAAAAASARAVTEVGAGMSAATAAAAAGTDRLSLANRLALAEAAQASRVAAGAAATTTSAYARAAAAAQAMGTRTAAGAAQAERSLKGMRTASLGLVAVFGAAVYESSRFESAMSRVKAATQAPEAELNKLRTAAIQAGSSTQYSASQSADAITELAKAGVSTADILGGALKGTLSLAAAGEMSVSDSAVIAAKAMNSFGLSGKDMSHIADVIAAAAGKSATDVHGMSLAFAQASLLAHQTGLTLEQTAGALALFAQNGLVGSDAGTSLKTMLMRLNPQSQQASDMMAKLGFTAYDAQGNFVGLSEVANRMQKSFSKLTPEARNAAMGVIFGQDAIRAATIITQAGASGIDQWTAAANDQGYAARYAATQADNLAGDLRRLKSALETALIQSGTAANGVLRDMAKALTDVVRWYSNLPPAAQKTVTVLTGVAGVVGTVAAGLLLLLPRIMRTSRELQALGLTAERTRGLMAGLGRLSVVVGALTAITLATDKITEAMKKPAPDVDKLTNSLLKLGQSGSKSADSIAPLDGFGDAVARIAHPSTLNRLDDVASSLGHLGFSSSKVGSYTEAEDKIHALDQALTNLVQNGATKEAAKDFKIFAAEANKSGTSTDKFKSLLPKYADALVNADTQTTLAATSQKALADQTKTTADDLKDTRTEVQKLTDALDALNGVNIDVATSQIQLQQSIADMRQTVKDNGHSLDITTDKGRKVKQGFLDMANAAVKTAEAVAQQKNSQEAGNKTLASEIGLIRQKMLAMGFQKTVVDKLLKSYLRLPSSVSTKVSAPGADKTAAALDEIRRKLAAVPAGKSITVRAPSAAAIADLKAIGYKVTTLPDHRVRITVPTKDPKAALADLQARIAALQDKTVVLTIEQRVKSGQISSQAGKNQIETRANGGIVGHAANGLFVPGYQPRVDSVLAMLSQGEGVLVPETVRKLGLLSGLGPAGIVKALNSWGRYGTTMAHFAGGGIVGGVAHMASGGFVYSPADPTTTLGVNAGQDRYNAVVAAVNAAGRALAAALADAAKKALAVRDAEENLSRVRSRKHTAAQLAAAEERLTKAREADAAAANKVAGDRRKLNAADAAAGVRSGTRSISGFNLAVYEKQLAAANAANASWERNLATVGRRAGADVEAILRGMGSDGTALVAALAKATGRQFNQIVAQLKALGPTAKATLQDYTQQLNAANKGSQQFQANLLKLAAMGDTALAAQLAAQGDDAAAAIAAQAVKSPGAAAAANASAKANASLLSSEDLANAVTLLGVLRSHPGAGIADVIAAGLDWTTVRALAPKISAQIRAVPGSATFVGQMRGQGVAMARGGLLTRPTTVLAAEAGSPEWWIPQNGSARSAALLSAAASGMGYQLVPAGRWAGAGGGTTTTVDNSRTQTVHLHGSHQSLGEQRADLLRHMQVVG